VRIQRRECVTRDGRPFEIRSPEPEESGAILDHQAIVHLLEPEVDVPDRDEFRVSVDALRAHVRRLNGSENGFFLVASEGKRVLGTLQAVGGRFRKIAHVAEIGLSVSREWRRTGVGATLVRTAIQVAREAPGLQRLTLRVFSSNEAALALYRAQGFVEEGRLAEQVRMADRTDDLLWLSLDVSS